MYRPYLICGLGNRMSGFQGALSLAMMTDRALLVDWEGGVRDRRSTASKYEGESVCFCMCVASSWLPVCGHVYERGSFCDGLRRSTVTYVKKKKMVMTPRYCCVNRIFLFIVVSSAVVVVQQYHINSMILYRAGGYLRSGVTGFGG